MGAPVVTALTSVIHSSHTHEQRSRTGSRRALASFLKKCTAADAGRIPCSPRCCCCCCCRRPLVGGHSLRTDAYPRRTSRDGEITFASSLCRWCSVIDAKTFKPTIDETSTIDKDSVGLAAGQYQPLPLRNLWPRPPDTMSTSKKEDGKTSTWRACLSWCARSPNPTPHRSRARRADSD